MLMPSRSATAALLEAYREEIAWFQQKAHEYSLLNPLVAADYIHRARNLESVVQAYQRLYPEQPELTENASGEVRHSDLKPHRSNGSDDTP